MQPRQQHGVEWGVCGKKTICRIPERIVRPSVIRVSHLFAALVVLRGRQVEFTIPQMGQSIAGLKQHEQHHDAEYYMAWLEAGH